jgi:mannose-6-phosphate isomerase-like protein (cupin superfamily)
VCMPDFDHLDWPFRYKHTRVPVLAVSGSHAGNGTTTPLWEDAPALGAQFHPITPPPPAAELPLWKPHPLFEGATPNVDRMSVHYSVLAPGHSPHPPHAHCEEEILLVIDGEAELIIGRDSDGSEVRREKMQRGDFVYYPAFQYHTISNASARPVTYLMFKWMGTPHEVESPQHLLLHRGAATAEVNGGDFTTELLFEGSTNYLSKLHAHLSELQPHAGYAPHADSHDVALITLSGEISAAGKRVPANGIIYFPAGEPHGKSGRVPCALPRLRIPRTRTRGKPPPHPPRLAEITSPRVSSSAPKSRLEFNRPEASPHLSQVQLSR